MISDAQMHLVGGSIMIVIPDAYVKHLGIDKKAKLGALKIEDISKSELKLCLE